jgi:hypothetical protein
MRAQLRPSGGPALGFVRVQAWLGTPGVDPGVLRAPELLNPCHL